MGILAGDIKIDKDALGLSKPLTKLIEVISDGVTGLAAPWQMKRIARSNAEAKKIELLAEEEMKHIASQEWNTPPSGRELRQMRNINNVVVLAAQNLVDEENISDEKVDPDWAAMFFDFVEKISKEDLQVLWGKILSEEIKKPNSYNARTLQTIFYLSKKEADSFVSLTKYVLNGNFIIFDNKLDAKDRLIDFEDFEDAFNLGLLNPFNVTNSFTITQKDSCTIGNKNVTLYTKNCLITDIKLPGLVLTETGRQFFQLAQTNPTPSILDYYKSYIEDNFPIFFCVD